jgi:transcriptional regulator with XRE-family HTH domain
MTVSAVLRQAITSRGMALLALERATGVQRRSIARFLQGKRSLRLDKADKLATFLGLELRPKEKG